MALAYARLPPYTLKSKIFTIESITGLVYNYATMAT